LDFQVTKFFRFRIFSGSKIFSGSELFHVPDFKPPEHPGSRLSTLEAA
jgi:hypothetical protein